MNLDPTVREKVEQSIKSYREVEFEGEKNIFLQQFPEGEQWIEEQLKTGVPKAIISNRMLRVRLAFELRMQGRARSKEDEDR